MFLCHTSQNADAGESTSRKFGDKIFSSFCKQFSGRGVWSQPREEVSTESLVCGASAQELPSRICCWRKRLEDQQWLTETLEHVQIQLPFPDPPHILLSLPQTLRARMKHLQLPALRMKGWELLQLSEVAGTSPVDVLSIWKG